MKTLICWSDVLIHRNMERLNFSIKLWHTNFTIEAPIIPLSLYVSSSYDLQIPPFVYEWYTHRETCTFIYGTKSQISRGFWANFLCVFICVQKSIWSRVYHDSTYHMLQPLISIFVFVWIWHQMTIKRSNRQVDFDIFVLDPY